MGSQQLQRFLFARRVLNAFRLEHPDVKVEIVEQNSMALEQMILAGEIDIALLVMSEAYPRLNIQLKVMKDETCLYYHSYSSGYGFEKRE